jgi:LysM repeat protein
VTLQDGDLILCGTPPGVGAVQAGQTMQAGMETPTQVQPEPMKPIVRDEPKKAAAESASPKYRTIKVQKGDTLWRLAARSYGKGTNANVAKLREMNPGLSDKNLKVGSQLRIAQAG